MVSVDSVYDELRAAILAGRMHPNERLVEADLTAMFGASRSAVRTALVRLEQEGVVEHERNRGAKVRVVGEDEAVEIYEVRTMLEALAARKAAEVATDEDIAGLRGLVGDIRGRLDADDLRGASDANMALHDRVLQIAEHDTVQRLVANLNTHLVRYHYRTIMHPDRPGQSFAEHSEIVEAIARRDPAAAEAAMRAHLSQVTASLRRPLPDRTE